MRAKSAGWAGLGSPAAHRWLAERIFVVEWPRLGQYRFADRVDIPDMFRGDADPLRFLNEVAVRLEVDGPERALGLGQVIDEFLLFALPGIEFDGTVQQGASIGQVVRGEVEVAVFICGEVHHDQFRVLAGFAGVDQEDEVVVGVVAAVFVGVLPFVDQDLDAAGTLFQGFDGFVQ